MPAIRAAAAAAFVAALVAAGPAAAADEPAESAYITALRACQSKTDNAERLACYDAAVAKVVSASSQGEVRVVDRAQVRETRRKLFGFALPDFGIFGGKRDKEDPEQADEFDALDTKVAGVRMDRSGAYVITTTEGAQWQLDEMPARLMSPKIGQPLEIRAGTFGSYFLRIDGQKGVKGRRVR
ncbi:MAG: hypothetical protein ACKO01_02820 [Erythrobacter sp.]